MIKINEIIACHGAADIPSYTNTWSFGPSNQCEEFCFVFSVKNWLIQNYFYSVMVYVV